MTDHDPTVRGWRDSVNALKQLPFRTKLALAFAATATLGSVIVSFALIQSARDIRGSMPGVPTSPDSPSAKRSDKPNPPTASSPERPVPVTQFEVLSTGGGSALWPIVDIVGRTYSDVAEINIAFYNARVREDRGDFRHENGKLVSEQEFEEIWFAQYELNRKSKTETLYTMPSPTRGRLVEIPRP